jgi:lipoate-protein ligase A
MRLLRTAWPERPAFDMAVTHALLRRVAEGALPAVARVLRPGPTVAFGRLDALRPGFAAAVAAARRHGYVPVRRLGGGHAAAYDEGSVLLELITPQARIAEGIDARFTASTRLLVDGLAAVGVTAVVGELPGEYCPGRFSVHAGPVKLAGIAQRSIRGAALVSGAAVAEGGARLRAVLVEVYGALDLAWDPSTAGAAEDVGGRATAPALEDALVDALGAGGARDREPLVLDDATLELARELEASHAL